MIKGSDNCIDSRRESLAAILMSKARSANSGWGYFVLYVVIHENIA
jgi:hypothetical protein